MGITGFMALHDPAGAGGRAVTPDGASLRHQWDVLCDDTASLLHHARDRARLTGDEMLSRYLESQTGSLLTLKRIADGRRRLPGQVASGLLRDAPPELAARPYKDVRRALERVDETWQGGLGAPEWDWSGRGYPPGWFTRLVDRIRAGLFYRAR